MKTIVALILTLGLSLALYNASTAQSSCGNIRIARGEGGRGHVGELVAYDFCASWSVVQFTVVSLPPGMRLIQNQHPETCISIFGSPTEPGTFEYIIAATGSMSGSEGSVTCTDTLRFTQTYICFEPDFYQPLYPSVNDIASGQVGQLYNQVFSAPDKTYELTAFRFEATAGAFPPGLALVGNGSNQYSNKLTGTPTAAGDFGFTLSAFLGSCKVGSQDYIIHIENSAATSCSNLKIAFGESGRGHVGELVSYTICPSSSWDVIHYTVLHLPPGMNATGYHDGDACITIFGSPTDPGTFEFSVAATGSSGGDGSSMTCNDTLAFTQTYICFPENTFQPLSPDPSAVNPAKVGQSYDQEFAVQEAGYETTPVRFEVMAGAVPPGLSFTTNPGFIYTTHLAGTPTTAGDYHFTLSAFFGSCLALQREYSVLVESADCGPIHVRSDYIGQEFHVGDTIVVNHPFVEGGTPPYSFSAITLPPDATFNSSGKLKFFASHPGNYSYTIRITDSAGCSDTFSSTVNAMCNPVALAEATLANGKKGQYYEQPVPPTHDIVGPFSNFQVFQSLPAGLHLSTDGIISGTPTEYGIFTFITISYQGLAGCSGHTDINITILNNVPVKTLYLYSLCSESDRVRNWKVYNQNNFTVNVTWETLYFNTYSGSISVVPGDNFFTTPNVGGPNTIRIKWADANGNIKALVQPSVNNLCTPPSCVVATSVDFYHQGGQKDGNHVPSGFSNPASALGAPDANDAADGGMRAFSLGYDGFIILQLNANLADQPGNDLTVYEYSANNPSFYSYPERAEVFASMNGIQWVSLGVTSPSTNCQQKLDTEFDLAGKIAWCRYIKILDITYRHAKILNAATCASTPVFAFNDASNGFDVDAVTCAQSTNSNLASGRTDAASTEGFLKGASAFQSVLYPNPTPGLLVIDFSQEPEFVYPEGGEVQVEVIDMNGASLYKKMHQLDEQWTTKCDVNQLPAGLFVTKVNVGTRSHFYKLVKY